jgi:protocatechuate 3,4-dioxygenase beta subunit
MKRALLLLGPLALIGLLAAPAGGRPAQGCAPTPEDGFGPFGRGAPPLRAKIGTGHVLTGVVLSALNCRPIRGAQVQLWQSTRGQYTRAGSATVVTNRVGRFRFEGPRPMSYRGNEPHIHLRVIAAFHRPLLSRYVPARGARSGNIRLVLTPEDL